MQLKLRRSQREGGVMSRTAIFCLDARIEVTREEQQAITRYKLAGQVIYNSETSKKHLERSAKQNDGSMVGGLKGLASAALAAMNLNISVASLQRGQHVECKSLDELLGAEEAIMTACQNLKGYLETAQTFDGREVLVDFATGQPEIIATATTPTPMLVAPATSATPSPAATLSLSGPSSPPAPTLPPPMPPLGAASSSDSRTFAPSPWDRLDPETRRLVLIIVGPTGGLLAFLLLLNMCTHQ
ncbi:MAG: hypothetical protein ACHP84_01145 [Caulobacterales bacterium]